MAEVQGWKYVTYEIAMVAGTPVTQQNFLINNYLVNAPIYAIEMYTSNDVGHSPISTANVVWTPAQCLEASVTFYCFDPQRPKDTAAKAEWIKKMPVNALHRNFNTNAAGSGSSVFSRMMFNGIIIDWNNSYINFAAAPTLAVATSALFGVYYGNPVNN